MWIVQTVSRLPGLIKKERPNLGGNLVERQGCRESRSISSYKIALHDIPEALLAWGSIQVYAAVCPVRRRRGGRCCTAPAASTSRSGRRSTCGACATLAASASTARSRVLRYQPGRQKQKAQHGQDHKNVKPMISHSDLLSRCLLFRSLSLTRPGSQFLACGGHRNGSSIAVGKSAFCLRPFHNDKISNLH